MAEAAPATSAEAAAERRRTPSLSFRTFSAFSEPAFRLVWANNFTYALAQGIQRFAFIWLALDLSKSNGVLGAVSFALGIPVLFFSLPAGVLSDRYDRRVLLIGSQIFVLGASLLTAALIWAGLVNVAVVLGLALLVGSGVAVGQPVRRAIVPTIVAPDRLMNAITLNSLGQNGSQIVGPALGGAAIAIWGIGASFALQSVLMGLGLLVLVPLRIPRTEARRQQRRIRAEIGEGFGFILRRADIRALFILLLGSALIMMGPWQALLLKIAKEELGSGPFSASMLFAAMGSGMICSSLLLASRPRIPNAGGWFATTLVTGGLLAVGIGLSNVYWLTFGFMLLSGLNAGFFINLNLTLIQSHTPNAVMGRVMSIYAFVQMGGSPLGSLLAGGGAEVVGAGEWFALCGAAMAALAALFLATQPGLRRMPSAPGAG